jgi:transcriptional regulator with XRE-family HTH domain
MEKCSGIEVYFGQVIRKHRKRMGLSQEQLALETDLDRTFISLIERGLRQPTLKTLFRIASVLQTPPSELIREVEEMQNEN